MCRKCGFSLAEHFGGGSDDEEDELPLDELLLVPPPPPLDDESDYASEGSRGASGRGWNGYDAAGDEDEEEVACRNYTWTRDGPCGECGFPKDAHVREDRGGGSARLSLSKLASRVSQRFSLTRGKVVLAKPEGVACDSFHIDLASTQYGLCVCGFNRLDHDVAQRKRSEVAARKTASQAENARVARGDPSKPCNNFQLDMENKEGYGYCKCGFHRERHQNFKLHGEFEHMRENLTRPKPFT